MKDILIGMGREFELFTAVVDTQAQRVSQDAEMTYLLRHLKKLLPVSMKDANKENGFYTPALRVYPDVNSTLEIATGMCASPREMVTYTRAVYQLLAKLRTRVEAEDGIADCFLSLANVDIAGATKGEHFSIIYQGTQNVMEIGRAIHAYLATCSLFTGAGGLDFEQGIHFVKSPRAAFIKTYEHGNSQNNRALLDDKDESFSEDHQVHRLHSYLWENLQSETALLLQYGATAIMVIMAEAGVLPSCGGEMRLANPVEALYAVARDTRIDVNVALAEGGSIGALAIQEHYCRLARTHLDADWMPSWAEEIIELWERILHALRHDPSSLDTVLDWRMRLALFNEYLQDLPYDATQMAVLNTLFREQQPVRQQDEESILQLHFEQILRPREESGVARLKSQGIRLHQHGLTLEDYQRFMQAREELWRLDFQFSMARDGIFTQLDRGDLLQHRLHENPIHDDTLLKTLQQSPSRSTMLGTVIRQFAKHQRCRIDWMSLYGPDEECLTFADTDPEVISAFKSGSLSDDFAVIEAFSALDEDPRRRLVALKTQLKALPEENKSEEARLTLEMAKVLFDEWLMPYVEESAKYAEQIFASINDAAGQEEARQLCAQVVAKRQQSCNFIRPFPPRTRRQYAAMANRCAGVRYDALACYRAGDYPGARHRLLWLLEFAFELPSTLCHLARIALVTDDRTNARDYAERAWDHRYEMSFYVVPRILWLQLADAMLNRSNRETIAELLGRLKTALHEDDDPCMEWSMEPVLEHLQPLLPVADHALLAALVAAMSYATRIPELDLLPVWAATQPIPL